MKLAWEWRPLDKRVRLEQAREHFAGLQALIFDLGAENRGVRLAAVLQLQHFLDGPGVAEAFRNRLTLEDDEECRFHLENGLRREDARRQRFHLVPTVLETRASGESAFPSARDPAKGSLPDPALDGLPPEKAFLERLNHAPPAERLGVLRTLSDGSAPEAQSILAALVRTFGQGFPPTEEVRAILICPSDLFRSDSARAFLAKCLSHSDHLILQRSVQILSQVSPVACLQHLPELLQHKSFSVRSMAISALARLHPEEARRLLAEYLDHPDAAIRGIGISLLFGFPFEQVAALVFALIEQQRIPPSSVGVVKALVQSNPDQTFLKNLALLKVRRPGEITHLDEFFEVVAEGLLVTGQVPGPVAGIRQIFLKEAETRWHKVIGGFPERGMNPLLPQEASSTEEPTSSGQADSEGGVVGEGKVSGSRPSCAGEGNSKDPLARFLECREWNDSWNVELEKVLPELQEDGQRILLADLVRVRRIRDRRITAVLTGYLEQGSEMVKIAAVNALAEVAPRVLHPHLTSLAFSSSAMMASLAIRKLRIADGGGFLRRLQEWAADSHPGRRKAVLLALTQMDFRQARVFILAQLKKAGSPELFSSFGNILLMNPEPEAYRDLMHLAENCSGEKKQLLLNLAGSCRVSLQEMTASTSGEGWSATMSKAMAELNLEDAALKALEQIRRIHYRFAGTDMSVIAASWAFPGMALLICLGIGWFLLNSFKGEKGELFSSGKVRKPVRTVVVVPPAQALLSEGATLAGILSEYDPFNRQWKFAGVDGSRIKILFPRENTRPAIGQRLLVTLSPQGKTPAGYPLYRVVSFRPLTP
jgi:hypothetical protein